MKTIGTVSSLGKKYANTTDDKVKESIVNSLGDILKEKELDYNGANTFLNTAKITKQLKDMALTAAEIPKPVTEATESLAEMGKTTSILSVLKTVISDIFLAVKGAFLAHPIIAGITAITAAIGAMVAIYNKFHKSQSEYIKDGEKAQEKISDTANSFNTTKKTISDLSKQYNKTTKEINNQNDAIDSLGESYSDLYKGVNKNTNENRLLSDEDYQSYLDISNQLAEAYPQLVSGTDAQGNAILNLGTNASEAAKSIRELYDNQQLLANVEINEQLKDVYDGVVAKIKTLKKESAEFQYDSDKVIQPQIDELKDSGNFVDADKIKDIIKIKYTKPDSLGKSSPYLDIDDLKLDQIGMDQNDIKNYIEQIIGKKIHNVWNDGTNGTSQWSIKDVTDEDIAKLQESLSGVISASTDQAIGDLEAAKVQNQKKIAANDLYIKDQWNNYAKALSQSLQTSSAFTDVQDQIQNAFISNLQNLDLKGLTEKYDGDPYQFLYNEFLTPISNLSEEAQDTLTKALQIDPSKLNLTTYQSQIKEALEKAFPDDKDAQDLFGEALGFDQTIKDASDTAVKLKNIAIQHVTDIQQTLGKLTNMTNGDKEIAYDILANDDFSGTFEELFKLVEKARKDTSESFDINATPKMDAVEKALESENAGSNYEKITDYISQARELYNKGLVGTDDFKSIAALLSPTGATDVANFEENIGKAMRYFTTDDASGVKNFLSDLKDLNKGYVELDESTNQYTVSINDLQKAASEMGMSFEAFMAVMKRTSDYGLTSDFFSTQEEGLNHLSDLYKERDEAAMHLAELQDQDGWTDGNETAISEAQKALDGYNQRIEHTKELINTLGQMTVSDYDNEISAARSVLKNDLKEWMNIDPKSENAKEIKEMLYKDMQSLADSHGIDISTWFKYDNKGNIIGLTDSIKEDIQGEIDKTPVPIKATLADKDIDYSKVQAVNSSDGQTTVLINPVLPNGEIMTDETLQQYVNDALEGNADTSQVLGVFNGKNSQKMADDYATAADIITKATKDSTSDLKDDLDTLSQYSLEELSSIQFNDGKWDEQFANAEKAIDDIVSKTGLNIDALITVLSKLGLLHVDVETENPKEPVDEVQKEADSNPVQVPVHYKYDKEGNEGVGGGMISVLDGMETPEVNVEQNEIVKYNVETENPEHVREQVQSDLDANPAKVHVEIENSDEIETPEGEVTIDVDADTSKAKEETGKTVKEIESTKATKKVDGDTTQLRNKVSDEVSNIENNTAVKPVDANTSQMEQSIDNVLKQPRTIDIQANVHYTAGASTLAGIGVDGPRANGTPFIQSGKFNNGRLGTIGRAFAQGGTVGEPVDTMALTGELGKELVVIFCYLI